MVDLHCRGLSNIPGKETGKNHRKQDAEDFKGDIAYKYTACNFAIKIDIPVPFNNSETCYYKTEKKERDAEN